MTQNLSWLAENLRFTILGTSESASREISWSKITGQEPDSVTSRPSQQVKTEEGLWGGGHLVLSIQPGRVDIALNAAPAADLQSLPSLGTIESAVDMFESSIRKIALPAGARIAVGAKLNMVPKNDAESLTIIKGFLPGLELADNVSDLMYQVNRPIKLKQSGIVLNRLVKISQLVVHTVQFPSNEAHMQPIVQVELDYNTAPASKLPHSSSWNVILQSMFAEAKNAVQQFKV